MSILFDENVQWLLSRVVCVCVEQRLCQTDCLCVLGAFLLLWVRLEELQSVSWILIPTKLPGGSDWSPTSNLTRFTPITAPFILQYILFSFWYPVFLCGIVNLFPWNLMLQTLVFFLLGDKFSFPFVSQCWLINVLTKQLKKVFILLYY